MAWSKSPKGLGKSPRDGKSMTDAVLNEFSEIVDQTVEACARRCRSIKTATFEAARILGLTERRVRAIRHREARSVSASEWLNVRARFAAHLEAEARRQTAEIDLLRARIEALRTEAA